MTETFTVTPPDDRQATFSTYNEARQWTEGQGFAWDDGDYTLTITGEN